MLQRAQAGDATPKLLPRSFQAKHRAWQWVHIVGIMAYGAKTALGASSGARQPAKLSVCIVIQC